MESQIKYTKEENDAFKLGIKYTEMSKSQQKSFLNGVKYSRRNRQTDLREIEYVFVKLDDNKYRVNIETL